MYCSRRKEFEIEHCREMLRLYYEAERTVLTGGQSYQIDGRVLSRANLSDIRAAIKDYENRLNRLERGSRIGRVYSVDN